MWTVCETAYLALTAPVLFLCVFRTLQVFDLAFPEGFPKQQQQQQGEEAGGKQQERTPSSSAGAGAAGGAAAAAAAAGGRLRGLWR